MKADNLGTITKSPRYMAESTRVTIHPPVNYLVTVYWERKGIYRRFYAQQDNGRRPLTWNVLGMLREPYQCTGGVPPSFRVDCVWAIDPVPPELAGCEERSLHNAISEGLADRLGDVEVWQFPVNVMDLEGMW